MNNPHQKPERFFGLGFKKKMRAHAREGAWFLRACFGRCNGTILSERNSPQIVVSLTSIPERMSKLFVTIESLLRQTEKPNKIILWLSNNMKHKKLPKLIQKQQKRGLTIRFCEDVGPHTKIHYALQDYPQDIIITCDDDLIYPATWLKGLMEAHRKRPDNIICYRAHEILYDENGFLRKYEAWGFNSPGQVGPSHLLFATGVAGVLYPPDSLHPEVLNRSLFERLCPTADDVWLKIMAFLKGTPVTKTRAFFCDSEFPTVSGSQKIRLWANNLTGGKNDTQIMAVCTHFGLTKFLKRTP